MDLEEEVTIINSMLHLINLFCSRLVKVGLVGPQKRISSSVEVEEAISGVITKVSLLAPVANQKEEKN